MLKLSRPCLSDNCAEALGRYQNTVNSQKNYAVQVEKAKTLFASSNRNTNRHFRHIKEKLKSMCPGLVRCHYCEDSEPDEIEHFKPKNLYPEACFDWKNYFYCCGRCNGSKSSKFKITVNGNIVDITRSRNSPVTPSLKGAPVLLNPEIDNPMDFIKLDFLTGFFIEIADKGTHEYARAEYTIELLNLNRDGLPEARKSAYKNFVARLEAYIHRKNNSTSASQLDEIKIGFYDMLHLTVWEEIKRQKDDYSALKNIFQEIPEALEW